MILGRFCSVVWRYFWVTSTNQFQILILTHFLIFNDVQDGTSDGAADRVAAERVEVLDAALAEVVRDLLRRDHSCNGMTITLQIIK